MMMTRDPFDLTGRVAIVTGGYGVLGSGMALELARAGARVAILGRRLDAAEKMTKEIRDAGGDAMSLAADVLERDQLVSARDSVIARWGTLDILVNAAGGNVQRARTDGAPVFGLPFDAFDEVVRLNLHGTVLPTIVFAEAMADRGKGSVVNISSMAAARALSGVLGYSVAKAAIDNFTRWMAVDLARRYGDQLRVNAVAPGFFVAAQNRGVLVNPDGSYTERARTIIARTPMARFGEPKELSSVVRFLCSDAASFITGTVIPVDGGFSADGGV
jgi:NAD(P)-dependent dehydrogenase (short-subunit alcohol dehydrogenase family)